MNTITKQYLRKRFRDYYQMCNPAFPPDFSRREWGFIFFDELPEVVMHRHKAFSSENEAVEYLRGMVPAHVYHSAAHYKFPSASTMKEKQWQGADLIFDLDADHLPVKSKSYAEMLSNVKDETIKLLDFLLEDFGFLEENISLVFSGGRGYHIHVRDPRVMTLESPERREIVDYVCGTGFDYESVFRIKKRSFRIHDGVKRHPMSHETEYEAAEMSAWAKRVAEKIIQYLEKIRASEYDGAVQELKKIEGMTARRAESIFKTVKLFKSYDDLCKAILKEGFGLNKSLSLVSQSMINSVGVSVLKAHTDEPVTADVKRLIRMPSSLHGGSGMKVVPLKLSELEKFEPLNDAVVFSQKEIQVEVISPLKPQNSLVEMKGKSFAVTEGKNTLPEYAAIYLMCRGYAEYA